MGEIDIPLLKDIKILSLTIDSKLTFNSHVTDVSHTAENMSHEFVNLGNLEELNMHSQNVVRIQTVVRLRVKCEQHCLSGAMKPINRRTAQFSRQNC